MDPLSHKDISGMADLIRALGDSGDMGIYDAPASTPRLPSVFRPGDIDPISGLPIEADFSEADSYMPEATPSEVMRAPRVPIGSEQQQDMKNLLRTFLESGGDTLDQIDDRMSRTTHMLVEDSDTMPELGRAMSTERLRNGVRVGGWQIVVEGNKAKKYNVVSVHSGQQIAKNLYLYEAAEALVNYLNDGMMINNMKIQSLLLLEMDYAKHIEDAIQHKHACSRALDRGDDNKLEVSKVR